MNRSRSVLTSVLLGLAAFGVPAVANEAPPAKTMIVSCSRRLGKSLATREAFDGDLPSLLTPNTPGDFLWRPVFRPPCGARGIRRAAAKRRNTAHHKANCRRSRS
jgi:hypothetical protein